MRGLDNWLSRGHERQDDPPEIEIEEHEFRLFWDAQIERELTAAQVYAALDLALENVLRKRQEEADAALGRWLVERNGGAE